LNVFGLFRNNDLSRQASCLDSFEITTKQRIERINSILRETGITQPRKSFLNMVLFSG
jgi:hypothetical protein